MRVFRLGLLVAAVALAGCAANVVKAPASGSAAVVVPPESRKAIALHITGAPAVLQSSDWAAFRDAWRQAMAAEASAAGIPLTTQDGQVHPTGQPGTLIAVHVNDYRYVSAGARFGLGVFTGNAYVNADVRFLDLKTGQPFGQESVNTSSSAWQGVFSAMTDKQLQAIAKDLVGDVKPR